MMVIDLQLWPKGMELQKRPLGRGEIANTGESKDPGIGAYTARFGRMDGAGVWRRGAVEKFPRVAMGPWDLLFVALLDAVGDRHIGRLKTFLARHR